MQHTCNVANATAIQGHLENVPCDFSPASMVTIRDEKRLIWTAWMLTAVPLFPLCSEFMFNHVGVLTSRTTNLEEGHGDLRYSA